MGLSETGDRGVMFDLHTLPVDEVDVGRNAVGAKHLGVRGPVTAAPEDAGDKAIRGTDVPDTRDTGQYQVRMAHACLVRNAANNVSSTGCILRSSRPVGIANADSLDLSTGANQASRATLVHIQAQVFGEPPRRHHRPVSEYRTHHVSHELKAVRSCM